MKARLWGAGTLLLMLLTSYPASARQSGGAQKGPARTGANTIERLRRMSPEERKKALEKLPPERRRQAEERLRRLDRMSAAERDDLERRYDNFQRLPSARQELARKMFRNFNDLPPDRRNDVRAGFERLRRMSSAERSAFLKSREFSQQYNRREQAILEDYAELLQSPQL